MSKQTELLKLFQFQCDACYSIMLNEPIIVLDEYIPFDVVRCTSEYCKSKIKFYIVDKRFGNVVATHKK